MIFLENNVIMVKFKSGKVVSFLQNGLIKYWDRFKMKETLDPMNIEFIAQSQSANQRTHVLFKAKEKKKKGTSSNKSIRKSKESGNSNYSS